MADIFLYNSLTRKKEKFEPINDSKVGMYTCGPTVYDYAHIGNLRSFIFADVLKRVLEYNGFEVKHVMNLTDVGHLVSNSDTGEDRMEKGARREHKSAWEIAKMFSEAFLKNESELNIEKPNVVCRATDHINEQIDLIKRLEEKGYTYRTADGIYYDTSKFKGYDRLMGARNLKKEAGKRVSMKEKRHDTDFALWKFSPKDQKRQMEWNSPWGIGFPGWHIECSAMSMTYLGDRFDIHTGGWDLKETHHPNEIAQNEAATGHKVVNFWLHVAFVSVNGEKMSKSTGTFITLDQLEERGFDPLDYRYLCLGTLYRKPFDFTWENLEHARGDFAKLKEKIIKLRKEAENSGGKPEKGVEKYDADFLEHVNNNLDTRSALNVLRKLLSDSALPAAERYKSVLEYDKVFGLKLGSLDSGEISKEVHDLAEERERARKSRNWKLADELRERIKESGYAIEDTENGYELIKKY